MLGKSWEVCHFIDDVSRFLIRSEFDFIINGGGGGREVRFIGIELASFRVIPGGITLCTNGPFPISGSGIAASAVEIEALVLSRWERTIAPISLALPLGVFGVPPVVWVIPKTVIEITVTIIVRRPIIILLLLTFAFTLSFTESLP